MEVLELTDPRWKQLKGTFSEGEKVAEQLADLATGRMSKERESHLWQELCHEYESTSAGYAAVPHLVRLAEQEEGGERALFLLGISAFVLSCSHRRVSHQIPDFLRLFLDVASERALKRIGFLLGSQLPPASTRTLAYCVAAFMKDARLFFEIEGLDCDINCPQCGHGFVPNRMPD